MADTDRVLIIAEVGSVHDGSLGNARKLIDLAARCGADAVKFQVHLPEAETLPDAPGPTHFQDEPRFDYFARTGFSVDGWRELKARAEGRGIEFMASAFSSEALALLESVAVKRHKVPSGEVTNLPLLHEFGRTGRPVIISSGMSSWAELDRAIAVLTGYHRRITVLQCSSIYPCPPEMVGLNVLAELKRRYSLPVGLSDHTLSPWAAVAAVALGASVIEKHLTFSRRMYGSDAAHSLEPDEFAAMVEGIRAVEAMKAHPVDKDRLEPYAGMKRIFEKSIVSLVDIPAGTVIEADMIGFRKPGLGLSPAETDRVIGARTKNDLAAGTIIDEADLERT